MALRNKPYLPLYVNDFMSDERLLMCSAEATGVYIRLMCIMHKSEQYGKILLLDIQKQSTDNIINFASVITKQVPYEFPIVKRSLVELLSYNIIAMDNGELVQKRMVKDNEISDKRALSGQKGGFATANNTFATAIAIANMPANSDIDINSINTNNNGGEKKEIKNIQDPKKTEIAMNDYKKYPVDDLYKSYIDGPSYQAAREAVCFRDHITMDQLTGLCKRFVTHLKTNAKFKTEMVDFVKHFGNWSRTQRPEQVDTPEPKRKTSAELLKEQGY